jgi:hypothetical protein
MSSEISNEPTQQNAPSPYESGASEKPVEHVAQELAATATEPAAEQPAVRQRLSPYETGAKPDEIWREHENRVRLGLPNASVEEICAEWNVEVPLEFEPPAQGTLS